MTDTPDETLSDDDMTTEAVTGSSPQPGGDADGTDGDATDTTDGDATEG